MATDKELFEEKIRGVYAAINANQEISNQQHKTQMEILTRIEKQTIKTNGRVSDVENKVAELELKDRDHIINCPQKIRVDEIHKDLEEYRVAKRYPKASILIFTALGLAMLGLYLIQLGIIG